MFNKQATPGLFFLIILSILFFPHCAFGKYSGGDGSAEEPYRIDTPNDLNEIGANPNDWDAHFVMVNDINMADYTGTQFNIIGNNVGKPFTGVFDGNSKEIHNFTYRCSTINYIGLFGQIVGENAQIRNLGLIDPDIEAGTGWFVGSLVGELYNGTITSCYVDGGRVSGYKFVGGLVGFNHYEDIGYCYSSANVSGDYCVGGLIGVNIGGDVYYCLSMSDVLGDELVGGLVGAHGEATISNCFSSGDVFGYIDVGGLVGGCDWWATISNCYSTGSVWGYDYVGGLVGETNLGTMLSNCYAAGGVDGITAVGGLVGYENPEFGSSSYNKCFWDNTINSSLTGIGNESDPNVIGETTTNMKKESTFTDAGWDFVGESVNGPNDIWTIHEDVDYPKHVWPLVNFDGWYEVDFLDYSYFANRWMDTNCGDSNDCDGVDLDFSDMVDAADLKIFCNYWLEGVGE